MFGIIVIMSAICRGLVTLLEDIPETNDVWLKTTENLSSDDLGLVFAENFP